MSRPALNSQLNCWLVLTALPTQTPKRRGRLRFARRVAAIEAGTVTLEPWEDVKRRIEKEILGR